MASDQKTEKSESKATPSKSEKSSKDGAKEVVEEKTDPQKAKGQGTNPDKENDESAIELKRKKDGPNIDTIPERLKKSFLIDGDSKKGRYYFRDNPDQEAFKDKGNRLTTKSKSTAVAASMVALAESKNWESITVKGAKAFRRTAWLEAQKAGLSVKGYEPTAQDIKEAEEQKQRNGKAQSNSIESSEKDKEPNAPKADTREERSEKDSSPAEYKKTLKEVYATATKESAVKMYPELAPVYRLAEAAKKFAEESQHKGKFDDQGKQRFMDSVGQKGIDAIAQGKDVKEPGQRVDQRYERSREAQSQAER